MRATRPRAQRPRRPAGSASGARDAARPDSAGRPAPGRGVIRRAAACRPGPLGVAGVGDRQEAGPALGERGAAQVGDAVLGDDEVGVGARRRDDAVAEAGDDPRDRAVTRRRGQGDDRAAARRHQRGPGEGALPTDQPDVAAGRRLAVDLAGEVDLDRRVDGVQRPERGRAPSRRGCSVAAPASTAPGSREPSRRAGSCRAGRRSR